MAVDQAGTIHLAWYRTALEVDWNLWSVWYGRSSDEGNTWQVTEMATPLFGDPGIAVDGENNIHLGYGRNIGHPDGRWHQWSNDGGFTWSTAKLLYQNAEHASGTSGGFDFALDGDNRLHMVNTHGDRRGDGSAWHMVWLGDRWSEPELLLDTEYHAHQARLAIAGGNELNFVALAPRQDFSLIYLRGETGSQAIETRPLPAAAVLAADETVADGEGLVAPTRAVPRVDLPEEVLARPPNEAPFDALIVGVGATALLLVLVIILNRRFSDKQHKSAHNARCGAVEV
jgi:hypothetical protein